MERDHNHRPSISREVQGGFIAHAVAFSDEGTIVFDSQELARERHKNRARLANPNNGYMKAFHPYSGNQELYNAGKGNGKGFAQGMKPPRGYSAEYTREMRSAWNTLARKNSKKQQRRTG